MEKWKSVNKEYEVSSLGNVRRIKSGSTKILKPEILKKGYLRVSIWENGVRNRKLIHRLVAEAFIPNPENKSQIDHINNNTSDNRVENLRWVTPKENVQHSLEQNRFVTEKKRSAYKSVRLTEERIKRLKEQGFKKNNVPWNKGKKGLQKHSEEWKKEASLRMKKQMKAKEKAIICIETKIIYNSVNEASKKTNISQGNISAVLTKKRKTAGGYRWEYHI